MSHFDLARIRSKPRPRLRRGMFVLPSLFTAGNIAAGYFSIVQTIDAISGDAQRHLDWAAMAILFAIPFDALDGRIARMTNTTTDFGRELDSLADLVTFGMAPSLLAFIWGFHFLPDTMNPQLHQHLLQVGMFICFLFLLGGASRLARFNISHDPQPRNPGRPDRKYFVGMPIPAAAGLLAASVHLCYGIPDVYWYIAITWLILVGLAAYLMVSTWRFWSAKEITLTGSHPFRLILLLALIAYVVLRFSNVVMFLAALLYMFSGIWARAAYGWQRRRRRPAASATTSAPHAEPESLGPRLSG
jgi:CDP-diacylglycerol--serine O-phosphatidyltransferase